MITCSHLLATVHNGGEGSRNLVLILEQMTVLPSQAPEPALELHVILKSKIPTPPWEGGREEEAGIKENPTATALKSQLLSSAARRRRWP